ncbi:YeeE/YedE family protein [uncultured Photobacterium sp.]|uniref:YeeE/YedE family protein n=1 Tax=uncultured Photobacterium sp. TaxID=173973 RepID=UPI00261F2271|nr:YeeE/YedE family protein [uncultured Photobacterium sp.]
MFARFVALLAGLLFGFGMMMSGMVNPDKVIGFLDFAGNWEPSLAFVMGGALSVFMPVYFFIIRKMAHPVCDTNFRLSNNKAIDIRLISGSVLFGIGWGTAGICPGPAVTLLAGGNASVVVFVASMLVGIWLGSKLTDMFESVNELKVNTGRVK